MNLVEDVQQKLNVDELQKIDPDTGNVKEAGSLKGSNAFYQLAIPAVLAGLYRFTRTTKDNLDIFNVSSGNLLSSFFDDHEGNVISRLSEITGVAPKESVQRLRTIAETAVSSLKENLSENPTKEDIASYLTGQRHSILMYLHPSLHIGQQLRDDTIDDSTNKMEGPITDFMHTIGQVFSGPGTDGKENI